MLFRGDDPDIFTLKQSKKPHRGRRLPRMNRRAFDWPCIEC